MRRITMLGAMLAIVLVGASVLANVAPAAEVPENLPFSATARGFTTASVGTPRLNSGADNVECEKAEGSGTEEPGAAGVAPHGAFHITLTKCKESLFGQTCTGTGDAAGSVLVLGTYQLVWDRKNGGSFELTVATVFFVKTAFDCTALAKLEFEGSQVCLDKRPTESNVTHEFQCVPTAEKGATQSEEYCLVDEGGKCTWIKPNLSGRLNSAKNEPAAEEASGTNTFTEAIAADAL
jgi:hypothetical protein